MCNTNELESEEDWDSSGSGCTGGGVSGGGDSGGVRVELAVEATLGRRKESDEREKVGRGRGCAGIAAVSHCAVSH